MQQPTERTSLTSPFTLDLISPFSSFEGGEPKRIPYVVDGLLPAGGFSILAGKPKHGKSSLSRYEAVCVATGAAFLGRETERGEVLLISLEDPLPHVDNCLRSLGYDPVTDEAIHLVTKLAPSIDDSIKAIERVLRSKPGVRLVIVDTLAKLLRVTDVNDYSQVLPQVEKMHDLARNFPQVHVQGLAHCKKIKTDDPFDSLLGSTALRGEPDTTIALYDDGKQRVIASETRIGRNITPSLLHADMMESAGADVVRNFRLEASLSDWQRGQADKAERGQKLSSEERVIKFLQACDGETATQEVTLRDVEGRRTTTAEAIANLRADGVILVTGKKRSPVDPSRLTLVPTALSTYKLTSRYGGRADDVTN